METYYHTEKVIAELFTGSPEQLSKYGIRKERHINVDLKGCTETVSYYLRYYKMIPNKTYIVKSTVVENGYYGLPKTYFVKNYQKEEDN